MYSVTIVRTARSLTIDPLNRSFVNPDDIMQQGMIFASGARSTEFDEDQVFEIDAITATTNDVWMVYEAEIVETYSGDGEKTYRGLDPDVRDFFIPAGRTFSAFKLCHADIVTIVDGTVSGSIDNTIITGTYTTGVQNYLIPDVANPYKWEWTTTEADFCLKVIEDDYISIANGALVGGLQRDFGYRFEVINK